MKIYHFLIVSLLLITVSFSQEPSVSDSDAKTEKGTEESMLEDEKENTGTDTAAAIEKTAESEELPSNPFVSDDEEQVESSDIPENPFTSDEETISEAETVEKQEGEERRIIDILVDLGIGASLSRFTIKPEDVSVEGKPSFLFNPGVLIPFKRLFFAGISIRYMQLSVDLSRSYSTISGNYPSTSVKTYTNEIMTFVSVPVKVGMRFELGKIIPYFYADIEPAYLTGSNQFISEEIHTVFMDGSEYFLPGEKNTKDMETTDNRKREQIFIGGGIGIEIPYGYGSVYLDGGCQYGVFDTDISEEQGHSMPWRSGSSVIYFPVSLGIRFFL